MDGQAQIWQQTFQAHTCSVHRTVEVGVHGDYHHTCADVLLYALLEVDRHAVCSRRSLALNEVDEFSVNQG